MPTLEILAWAMALVVRVVLNTIRRIFSGGMPSVMLSSPDNTVLNSALESVRTLIALTIPSSPRRTPSV